MERIPCPSNRARGFVRRRLRAACPSERLRFQILQAFLRASRPETIVEVLGVSPATVYRVRARYLKHGVIGLCDRRSCRGATKVTPPVIAALTRLVQSPPEAKSGRSNWTTALLTRALEETTGILLHLSWVWQLVRRMGYRWKRTRPMVRRCNPSRRWQWARLVQVLWSIPPGEVVLFADEVDIDFNPKAGHIWCRRGEPAEIETPGRNQKRYLAGAVNVDTGHFLFAEGDQKRSWLFISLLQILRRAYRSFRRIHLLVDNYSIHKSGITRQALQEMGGRIRLHFLPGYSPEYNPVERVWQQLHDAITRNHRFPTMEALMEAVRQFLLDLSPIELSSPLPFRVTRIHGLVLAESK
jgi:transposase